MMVASMLAAMWLWGHIWHKTSLGSGFTFSLLFGFAMGPRLVTKTSLFTFVLNIKQDTPVNLKSGIFNSFPNPNSIQSFKSKLQMQHVQYTRLVKHVRNPFPWTQDTQSSHLAPFIFQFCFPTQLPNMCFPKESSKAISLDSGYLAQPFGPFMFQCVSQHLKSKVESNMCPNIVPNIFHFSKEHVQNLFPWTQDTQISNLAPCIFQLCFPTQFPNVCFQKMFEINCTCVSQNMF